VTPSHRRWRKRVSSLTGSGRADAGVFALDGVELDVEDSLFDSTRHHVSGETDDLLGPDERVREVICHGTKAFVAKNCEFVQPWVIDEARVAQPIDRELRVVGIWDDGRNDSDLSAKDMFVISCGA
jgi:hypothetical protein